MLAVQEAGRQAGKQVSKQAVQTLSDTRILLFPPPPPPPPSTTTATLACSNERVQAHYDPRVTRGSPSRIPSPKVCRISKLRLASSHGTPALCALFPVHPPIALHRLATQARGSLHANQASKGPSRIGSTQLFKHTTSRAC
ncbi:hypothetical protein E2C01_097783 [Portunus trituberculatus]|uniref:Uncharacterized protein n=1 Tax=Portunus trituberculatus TaxID=210409 RepID=A0A5B7K5Q8_PORTR|nr:hypothetical protein [Portunus trituberculatus]